MKTEIEHWHDHCSGKFVVVEGRSLLVPILVKGNNVCGLHTFETAILIFLCSRINSYGH